MTVIWFTYFGLYAVALLPISFKVKRLIKKGETEKKDELLKKAAKNIVRRLTGLAGIKIHIEGLETVPEGPVLYVANHQSMIDVAAMLMMREPCGFVIKQEVEKIPLISTWMKFFDSVFIERDNIKQAARAINQAADIIKSGKSLIIFPEGTRSTTGKPGEFKAGAFRIAQKTGVTIVPVAIDGTRQTWEAEKKIRGGDVFVKVLPAVKTAGMTREETKMLPEQVKGMIEQALDDIRKK